jgi:PP-loop superfamily ATP-utilizing enzyme
MEMNNQTREPEDYCYACNRKLRKALHTVITSDGQRVDVGPDCYDKIDLAGSRGYQPPLGGPKLFTLAYVDALTRIGM